MLMNTNFEVNIQDHSQVPISCFLLCDTISQKNIKSWLERFRVVRKVNIAHKDNIDKKCGMNQDALKFNTLLHNYVNHLALCTYF